MKFLLYEPNKPQCIISKRITEVQNPAFPKNMEQAARETLNFLVENIIHSILLACQPYK
jgi:hypothetical protein